MAGLGADGGAGLGTARTDGVVGLVGGSIAASSGSTAPIANASAKSEQVAKRAFGSRAMALVIAESRPRRCGCVSESTGGGLLNRCPMITAGFGLANGGAPVSR